MTNLFDHACDQILTVLTSSSIADKLCISKGKLFAFSLGDFVKSTANWLSSELDSTFLGGIADKTPLTLSNSK